MTEATDALRLFVAVDLPATARAAVEREIDVLAQAGADVRWAKVEQLHLTLKFIGDTAPPGVAALRDALRAVPPMGQIQWELRGLGRFPPPGRGAPRVFWAGLSSDGLVALQRAVGDACAGCGVAREARPFEPHLTLGRVRSSRDVRALEQLVVERSDEFAIELPPLDRFRLYRSELRPTGAVHEVVEEFTLR